MREELLETEAVGDAGASTSGGGDRRCGRAPLPARVERAVRDLESGAARCGPRRSPPPAAWSPARRRSPRFAPPRGSLGPPARRALAARQRAPRRTSSRAARSWSTSTCSATGRPMAHGRRRRRCEVEVRPPWPSGCAARLGGDGVLRGAARSVTRLLHVDGAPVVVRAWQPERRDGEVVLRGGAPSPRAIPRRASRSSSRSSGCASRSASTTTTASSTSAFRADPLIGPAIRRQPWHRPRRRPWAWEALAWAITEQLIEVRRGRPRSSGGWSARWGARSARRRRRRGLGLRATSPTPHRSPGGPRRARRDGPGRRRARWR